MSIDIFSALYRWASAQGENFTTDAFASLLREMIKRDPDLASRFLGWLCFGHGTCAFFGPSTEVETQWVDQLGRPDMRIIDTDGCALALVEIKTLSPLHGDQLKNYRAILDRESAREKRLVLITAFDASVGQDRHLLSHWRRWHEVEEQLKANSSSEPVVQFLVEQFTSFLRGTGMSYDRVRWEYVDGVKSLVDLTHILFEACGQAGVALERNPQSAWSSGEPWVGLYTAKKEFWVGVWWNRPQFVSFQFWGAQADSDKLKDKIPRWELATNKKWERRLDLLNEDVYFFSRTKKSQVDLLAEFIKDAHAAASDCIDGGGTPPQAP